MKKGQALLISQAWDKHKRDQAARFGVRADRIRNALVSEFEANMSSYVNDEVFVHAIDMATCLNPASQSTPSTSSLKTSSLDGPFVSEVYTNTQRVMREASKRGHRVGTPLSLETGWNFLLADHREQAKKLIRKEKPYFLLIAFPCGPFSPLMHLNPSTNLEEILEKGRVLMNFALELAAIQLEAGRHYVLENPRPSAAWKEPSMIKFLDEKEAVTADFDQCRFNLRSALGGLHRKATRIASSSPTVASRLDGKKCMRTHGHDQVIGGKRVTAPAGHCPGPLARALVLGMEDQFHREASKVSEVLAVGHGNPEAEEEDFALPAAVDSETDDDDGTSAPDAKIPAAIRAAVARLHDQTGHRSNRRLARALTIAGAPASAIQAAKQHKCSICAERAAPKSQRVGSLPNPRDVSDQVHIDLLEAEDCKGTKYYILHCTDFCTRFQMSQILERKTAAGRFDRSSARMRAEVFSSRTSTASLVIQTLQPVFAASSKATF